MHFSRLFLSYFFWHYTKAYAQIFTIWKTYLWYITQLFSIALLLRTLFSPWKRMTDVSQGGFNIEAFLSRVIVNFMSRIVGFIVRVPLIILGLVLSVGMCLLLVVFYIYWTVFPVLIFALLISGISFLYG
ncbi:MAG: hypothetical protein ACI9H6_000715 [Patiriisocius sp.]|jgi:hypothetical protein